MDISNSWSLNQIKPSNQSSNLKGTTKFTRSSDSSTTNSPASTNKNVAGTSSQQQSLDQLYQQFSSGMSPSIYQYLKEQHLLPDDIAKIPTSKDFQFEKMQQLNQALIGNSIDTTNNVQSNEALSKLDFLNQLNPRSFMYANANTMLDQQNVNELYSTNVQQSAFFKTQQLLDQLKQKMSEYDSKNK